MAAPRKMPCKMLRVAAWPLPSLVVTNANAQRLRTVCVDRGPQGGEPPGIGLHARSTGGDPSPPSPPSPTSLMKTLRYQRIHMREPHHVTKYRQIAAKKRSNTLSRPPLLRIPHPPPAAGTRAGGFFRSPTAPPPPLASASLRPPAPRFTGSGRRTAARRTSTRRCRSPSRSGSCRQGGRGGGGAWARLGGGPRAGFSKRARFDDSSGVPIAARPIAARRPPPAGKVWEGNERPAPDQAPRPPTGRWR
jgi:hypothetical protein